MRRAPPALRLEVRRRSSLSRLAARSAPQKLVVHALRPLLGGTRALPQRLGLGLGRLGLALQLEQLAQLARRAHRRARRRQPRAGAPQPRLDLVHLRQRHGDISAKLTCGGGGGGVRWGARGFPAAISQQREKLLTSLFLHHDGAHMPDEIDDAGRLGERSHPERVVVRERMQVVQVPRRRTRTRAERENRQDHLVVLRAVKRKESAVRGKRARRARSCSLKYGEIICVWLTRFLNIHLASLR